MATVERQDDVDEPAENRDPNGAQSTDSTIAVWHWVVICCAVYAVRVVPWSIAEFWHDEIITLGDFAIGPPGASMLHVFRSYPVANNHILFSAVAWWWVRFTSFASEEYLMRLPSVIFGVLSIVMVIVLWRRWLGRKMAFLAAITVAVSPVFCAFAYQLRGYSLTMMLTIPAVSGLAAMTENENGRQGLGSQVLCLLLLPLIIPSNVMLAFSHALFLLIWHVRTRPLRRRVVQAVLVGGAGLIGLAYYLSIWDQFVAVLRQTSGWDSAGAVLGNVVLGFVAHTGVIAIAVPFLWRRRRKDASVAEEDSGDISRRNWGALYLACLAVPVVLSVLIGPKAPFPRVYLVLLLPATFALARMARDMRLWQRYSVLVWAALAVAAGFVWERSAAMLTDRALENGHYSQNLLQQYYRGRTDLKGLAKEYADELSQHPGIVVANAYDFPTFRFYWVQHGLPSDAVTALNRDPEQLWSTVKDRSNANLYVVAVNEMEAARIFTATTGDSAFKTVISDHPRSLYVYLEGRF